MSQTATRQRERAEAAERSAEQATRDGQRCVAAPNSFGSHGEIFAVPDRGIALRISFTPVFPSRLTALSILLQRADAAGMSPSRTRPYR